MQIIKETNVQEINPNSLILGDCLERLKNIPDNSVDAVVTDPPYGLSNHKPEEVIECLSAWIKGEPYLPKGTGFMGKSWDAWVPDPLIWKEVLRVLKPGGHALVFAGTRSMDLMSISLRLAGFELRDSIGFAHDSEKAPLLAWCHGQGFPKSLDISKAIDKAAGVEREVIGFDPVKAAQQTPAINTNAYSNYSGNIGHITIPSTEAAKQWEGWGTSLKPAWEPILLCRKPLEGTVVENVLTYGTGGINIEGCRVPIDEIQDKSQLRTMNRSQKTEMSGWGMNVNGSDNPQVISPSGRFPANLIYDGSEEVLALFPETKSGKGRNPAKTSSNGFTKNSIRTEDVNYGDSGSAARFFYCAKTSPKERNMGCEGLTSKERPIAGNNQGTRVCVDCGLTDNGNLNDHSKCSGKFEYRQCKPLKNNHPTVKPLALIEYLIKLISRKDSVILDPFMGSGTAGIACVNLDRKFIGIEQDPDYFEIAYTRIINVKKHQQPKLFFDEF